MYDNIPQRSAEDRDAHETAKALLTVLRHRAIVDAVDIEKLADLAVNAKSERHRLRAAQALQKARQDATRTLADIDGVREEALRDKGLSKNTTEHVHRLDIGGMSLEKLRALANGADTPPALPDPVRAEVVDPATPEQDT